MDEPIDTIEELQRETRDFFLKQGREPQFYVLHPQTWYQLCQQCFNGGYLYLISHMKGDPTFKGHPVYRSTDLQVGEVRIG